MTRKAGNGIQAPGRARSAHGFAPRKGISERKIPNFGGFGNGSKEKNGCFFSGNSTWWIFHGITCPSGNSRCGICPFQLKHPQPVDHFTHLERLIIFSLCFVALRPRVLLAAPCLPAPLHLFPIFIPLFVHKNPGRSNQRGNIVLKYPQTGSCKSHKE